MSWRAVGRRALRCGRPIIYVKTQTLNNMTVASERERARAAADLLHLPQARAAQAHNICLYNEEGAKLAEERGVASERMT